MDRTPRWRSVRLHSRWTLLAAFLLLSSSAVADAPEGFAVRVDKVLKSVSELSEEWGIAVRDVESSEVWLARGDAGGLNLASNAKMITTAAALARLGADHLLETRVLGAKAEDGTVEGDLYLVGGGDPKLVPEQIKKLVKAIRTAGVRTVTGQIVVDDSLFGDVFLPPGFDQKHTDAAYRASVGALSVNYNAVGIGFRPGKTIGAAPRLSITPRSAYALIDNRATTVAGVEDHLTITAKAAGSRTRIRLSGSIGIGRKAASVRRRIDDPGIHAGHVILAALRRAGVVVAGEGVVRGKAPAGVPVITTFASATIGDHVRDTNLWSNNMMAETLYKLLGRSDDGGTATWDRAREAVAGFLETAGVKRGDYQFLNGSGLYEADRLSAVQMTQFLGWARQQSEWGETFVESLPEAGRSGTLRRRMRSKRMRGRVRAKTGTLDHVIALSGYVTARSGKVLVFSFLFNGLDGSKSAQRAARRLQDRLCEVLAGF